MIKKVKVKILYAVVSETVINTWLEQNKVEIVGIFPFGTRNDAPGILIVYYEK